MGVANKDVHMIIGNWFIGLLGIGPGAPVICDKILLTLLGELTLSDSMINESTLNSFFKNSATF